MAHNTPYTTREIAATTRDPSPSSPTCPRCGAPIRLIQYHAEPTRARGVLACERCGTRSSFRA